MKRIEVRIQEKDKGKKRLSLLNLREEIVNFLYKDTIANSTKADLQFFILIFFISVKIKNATLIEYVLDEALPKFRKLNKSFSKKKTYLQSGEYQNLVKENGLTEIFKYDIFFILLESILNIEEIEHKFYPILEQNSEIKSIIKKIRIEYGPAIDKDLSTFESSRIKDDRYDDNLNYQDLSKSVYRTVQMRNSRNFDLNLQKYTSVKEITSNSPIDLTFLQDVDLQIIFDLWDKYHLAEYVKGVAFSFVTSLRNYVDFNVNLGDLVNAFLIYKLTPSTDKKEKLKAKMVFENQKTKSENNKLLTLMTETITQSILDANEHLLSEIKNIKNKVDELSIPALVSENEEEIEKLKERITQLENLSVSARVVEDRHDM